MSRRNLFLFVLLVAAALVFSGCAHAPDRTISADRILTIAHVNDTHSHLDPAEQTLTIGGVPTKAQLGGFARLKTALDEVRRANPNVLVVHGGDMVQGTFYFIKYQGRVDSEFLNLLAIDAACPGNHEFDKGPGLLAGMIDRANFPIVAANLDVSREPLLAGKLLPHIVKKIGPHDVGIIGVTTPEAAIISNPGPNVAFLDAHATVMRSVRALQAQGIRTIVLVSHLGYEEDMELAKKLSGVAVIVGGHTHSLLGDRTRLKMLGLVPAGEYPTAVQDAEGKTVLVVQSWEWAKALGSLRITLDEDGRASSWSGGATLIVGDRFSQKGAVVPAGSAGYEAIRAAMAASASAVIYPDDPEVRKRLDVYSRPIQEMMATVIGRADQELRRVNNAGPGPLVADAMLWKTRNAGAVIALQNPGGVRKDIPAGEVTIGSVYELLPFGNTLVLLDLSGLELKAALEDAVEHQLANGSKEPYLYVSGVSFQIDVPAAKGQRIQDLKVVDLSGAAVPVRPEQKYRIVTNNYLADGGDGMKVLKNASGFRSDTGFSDAEMFMEFIRNKGVIRNPEDTRILIRPVTFWLSGMKKAA
jgi:5'-nucleotidase